MVRAAAIATDATLFLGRGYVGRHEYQTGDKRSERAKLEHGDVHKKDGLTHDGERTPVAGMTGETEAGSC
jgi:hypothetical protein